MFSLNKNQQTLVNIFVVFSLGKYYVLFYYS